MVEVALTADMTDADLIASAVRGLTESTRFPVAFGGWEQNGAVHVTATSGTRTHMIDGLVVRAERGLGGRAIIERRPRLALDYRTSRSITHDYDRAILGEGISTLFAIPIIVSGRTRGLLYCGSWRETSIEGMSANPAFSIAQSLAAEVRIRDEVADRVSASSSTVLPPLGGAAREELRESYAELRAIAGSIDDPVMRERLAAVERRIAALSGDGAPSERVDTTLSRREVDVLSCASLGQTNAQIAENLGLRAGTVKSYLQSAMSKLGVSTRHAAVTKARRAGILP
ncbi:LuxR C-terminal-related transcriptional regulator [Microbacterium sediminicola]|uniref:LuxR C-terminal-related transcriptional regulator n=1 Tax=Microbacterium sediminicola TaxID=415210 RepID=A0ABP4U4B4_9MICO